MKEREMCCVIYLSVQQPYNTAYGATKPPVHEQGSLILHKLCLVKGTYCTSV